MVYRIPLRRLVWFAPVAGLALLIIMEWRPAARADVPRCGGAGCPNCPVNSKFFGYYPTMWRRWPGTETVPQPTTPPPPTGAEVPSVEPPPAMEETETKPKSPPPETPAGPGGSSTEPGGDPNAKRPMPPAGNGSGWRRPEIPSPDAGEPGPLSTPQINRLRPAWGNELAPSMTESLGPVLSLPTSTSASWPPPNFLRREEIRASFQANERPASADSKPMTQSNRESGNLAIAGEASIVIRQPTVPPPSTETPTEKSPARIDKAECDAGALHWIEASAAPKKFDQATVSPEPMRQECAKECIDAGLPRNRTSEPEAPLNGNRPDPSTATRIPLVPSNSIHDPLAPIEPRSVTGGKEPVGRTPADAPSNQLVPADRVSDVPMPATARQVNAAVAQPAPAAVQDSLTRIDPVAIGRSLDSTRPNAQSQSPSGRPSKNDLNFADGVIPPANIGPVVAPRVPTAVGPKSAGPSTDAPCFGAPPVVVPQKGSIEADFAVPTAATLPTPPREAIPATGGAVTTADFELPEPAMPAKVTDVDPLHALAAPGSGFPPLSARAAAPAQRAVATVSDGPVGALNAVQPAAYSRPNASNWLPPSNQNRAIGRSGEAFSSDSAAAGSASVSDSSPTPPTQKPALHWGR